MSDFRFGFTTSYDNNELIKNLGADYQEVNFGALAKLSDAEIDALIKEAQEKGYSYEAANCMISGEYKITIDNADFDALHNYLDKTLSKAARMGIKIVVLGSSGARDYPEGVTYETAMERFTFFAKTILAPLCEKHGIVCALENLSYGESNILNTIEESLQVVEAVNSPFVKILVDFYHFGFNKDSADAVRKAKEHIVHIHVASVENRREFPCPNDGEDYGKITDLLREIGYDKREGRISFEAKIPEGKEFSQCVTESLEAFKNI